MFVVDSGACTVTSTATCFRSPNYPAHYDIVIDTDYDYMGYNDIDINQACTITALEAVTLSVTAFSTEPRRDYLWVNGVRYSGTTGPNGVQVAAGSTITFTSGGSVTRTGFEICSEAPTTSPTTITPTIVGQTWTPTASPTSAPTSPTVSPTTTPNTLEDDSAYQACIVAPSTCTRLYVPPPPSCPPACVSQLSSHEVAAAARV